MKEELSKLLESINLFELCREVGIILDNQKKTVCLFHLDRSPSLQIYSDHAFCFSCHKRANAIDLYRAIRKCDFKEAVNFLSKGNFVFQNQKSNRFIIPSEKIAPQFSECMKNKYYKSRIKCLNLIYNRLNKLTQETIKNRKIPAQIHRWLISRGFNIEKTLLNYSNRNILFLTESVEILSKYVRDNCEEWELSGIFYGDKLKRFSKDYSVIFPIFYPVLQNDIIFNYVTSFRFRHTNPMGDDMKDVEISKHPDCDLPSNFGFLGIGNALLHYPAQIMNKCAGLKVILTEGAPDMIAAHFMFCGDKNTISLSTGNIQNYDKKITMDLIDNCEELILAFDNDEAGIKTIKNSVIKNLSAINFTKDGFYTKKIKSLQMKNCKDLNELHMSNQAHV